MQMNTGATAQAALVVIATVVAGAALYWLRGILTPLALAIFLLIMIEGFARTIEKRVPGVNGSAATALALGLTLAAFGMSLWFVANNMGAFALQLNAYAPRLNAVIADAASAAGIQAEAPTFQELINRLNPGRLVGMVARSVQGFASDAVFVLIYLGFLIATRRGFKRKSRALFPDPAERREAADMFEDVRTGVEKYLWVQTVTGLLIAGAAYLIMVAVGLSNAWFWAFFIFITGYVPIIGPAVGLVLPCLFSLVELDGYARPIIMFLSLQGVNFLVGNVIYPRMQSDSLNLDPVVVLLALAFWGALWGIPGAFLSTPLTVTAMVILAQFQGSRWIAVLMSGNGDPAGADHARRREAGKGAQAPEAAG